MKLKECNRCNLCEGLHLSLSRGHKPASVMIVFHREILDDEVKLAEAEFMRALNYELKYDWYKAYAIKCAKGGKARLKHLDQCKVWLQKELEKVEPFLVIMMGTAPALALIGDKYKRLSPNAFYIKDDKRYFLGEKINGDRDKIKYNVEVLTNYIKRYYQ